MNQHVLHVRVVSNHGGGPDKTILRSPSYVDHQRYPMTCAYLYPKGDEGINTLRQTARRFGTALIAIPEQSAIDFNAVRHLLNICRQKGVTIWHGHDYKSDLLGLILRRWHSMKLVTTAHGFTRETLRTKLYYHVDNLAMRRYDHVIAVSPPLLEHGRDLGIADEKLSYIPNAIEPAEYTYRQRQSNEYNIGVIGRFSLEKGIDRAIRAFAEVRKNVPAHLHLVGDGPQRESLRSLADELEVNDSITWHGWQTDTKPIFDLFDLLLLPSHTEGLPNVVLEAMALGVPIAATDVGGVRELLDDGKYGTLLDPTNTTFWAMQIRNVLAEPYEGLAARQWIENRYSFEARMRKIVSIYDRVTQPAARPMAA